MGYSVYIFSKEITCFWHKYMYKPAICFNKSMRTSPFSCSYLITQSCETAHCTEWCRYSSIAPPTKRDVSLNGCQLQKQGLVYVNKLVELYSGVLGILIFIQKLYNVNSATYIYFMTSVLFEYKDIIRFPNNTFPKNIF